MAGPEFIADGALAFQTGKIAPGLNSHMNPEKIRKLTDSTLVDGEGRKWAEYYYK